MLIHKGKRFEISCEGDVAFKTDGKSTRKMRFFPERDVSNIAGEIDEISAWRLLRDVALQAIESTAPISPVHVFIDGEGFHLSDWSESVDLRFKAPEGYSPVWALGATVFYVFLGCHVFQSRGGAGQSSTAPVPVVRRELPELSSFIARCLDYSPGRRPSLKDIVRVASENINRCKELVNYHPPLKYKAEVHVSHDLIDSLWPDEM